MWWKSVHKFPSKLRRRCFAHTIPWWVADHDFHIFASQFQRWWFLVFCITTPSTESLRIEFEAFSRSLDWLDWQLVIPLRCFFALFHSHPEELSKLMRRLWSDKSFVCLDRKNIKILYVIKAPTRANADELFFNWMGEENNESLVRRNELKKN